MSQPKRDKNNPGIVQVSQADFEQMLTKFGIMCAKVEKQENQLKAVSNIHRFAAQQENALKIEKKKARHFESAYIASEAKLGHLIKNLFLKEGQASDLEILESTLKIKTEDLYGTDSYLDAIKVRKAAKDKAAKSKDKSESVTKKGDKIETDEGLSDRKSESGSRINCDIEPDSAPESLGPIGSEEPSIKSMSDKAHKKTKPKDGGKSNSSVITNLPTIQEQTVVNNTTDIAPQTSPNDASTALQKTQEDTEKTFPETLSSQLSPIAKQLVDDLLKQRMILQNTIKEFREEKPEAWKCYMECKQYEDVVKNLRLEVASLRIHNSELQRLLAAKQGNNTDALAANVAELEKQLSKLNKQLTAKHALLHSINSEYEKVKHENSKLKALLPPSLHPEALKSKAKSSQSGENETKVSTEPEKSNNENSSGSISQKESEERVLEIDWNSRYSDLEVKMGRLMEATEKDTMELKNMVEKLSAQKESLEVKCKEYASLIEEMKRQKPAVEETSMKTVSWTELKEENDKLKASVEGYRHELDQNKKDMEIINAQIQIYQEDYQKEIEERHREKDLSDKEKTQLINTIKSLQHRNDQLVTEMERLSAFHEKLQEQFNMVQKNHQDLVQTNQQLETELRYYKSRASFAARPMHEVVPSPYHQIIQGASFAGGVVETDGSPLPSPKENEGKKQPQSAPEHNFGGSNDPFSSRPLPDGARSKVVAKEIVPEEKLECPQCYREFKPQDKKKFEDHKRKCVP